MQRLALAAAHLLTLLLMAVSLAGGIAVGANRDRAVQRTSAFAAATSTSAGASPTASPSAPRR